MQPRTKSFHLPHVWRSMRNTLQLRCPRWRAVPCGVALVPELTVHSNLVRRTCHDQLSSSDRRPEG
eukprot:1046819-Prorocentrum_lima.AAC.1